MMKHKGTLGLFPILSTLVMKEQVSELNIPETEFVKEPTKKDKLLLEYQNKMANWGKKKRDRFNELLAEGVEFPDAWLAVENNKGEL